MKSTSSPLGIVILAFLKALDMSQTDLARHMGRPIKTVNEIIRGKTALSAESAIQLEGALGVTAEFWLTLEQQYRLQLARAKSH